MLSHLKGKSSQCSPRRHSMGAQAPARPPAHLQSRAAPPSSTTLQRGAARESISQTRRLYGRTALLAAAAPGGRYVDSSARPPAAGTCARRCKLIAPVYSELAAKYPTVQFLKVDIDNQVGLLRRTEEGHSKLLGLHPAAASGALTCVRAWRRTHAAFTRRGPLNNRRTSGRLWRPTASRACPPLWRTAAAARSPPSAAPTARSCCAWHGNSRGRAPAATPCDTAAGTCKLAMSARLC